MLGKVTHFFGKISVAVLELSAELKVGDKIFVESAEPFEQVVDSMQIDKASIPSAKAGQSIGLKLKGRAHPGDMVYKVIG